MSLNKRPYLSDIEEQSEQSASSIQIENAEVEQPKPVKKQTLLILETSKSNGSDEHLSLSDLVKSVKAKSTAGSSRKNNYAKSEHSKSSRFSERISISNNSSKVNSRISS